VIPPLARYARGPARGGPGAGTRRYSRAGTGAPYGSRLSPLVTLV